MQRKEIIKEETLKIIKKLSPPRAIANDTNLIRDEAMLLVDQMNKLAPTRGIEEWFKNFEETLRGDQSHRSWPTLKDLKDVAKKIAPKSEFLEMVKPVNYEPDRFKINANRIKGGQPVCERYINGTEAQLLLRKGLVTEDDLMPYQEYIANSKI